MIDFRKVLDVNSLQAVILIVLGLASVMVSASLYSGITTMQDFYALNSNPLQIVSWLLSIISIIVMGWVGFAWVRHEGGSAMDGGKAGAVVGIVTGLINSVVAMVFLNPVLANIYQAAGLGSGMTGAMAVFGVIGGIIGGAIMGFILGLIGGAFGKKK